MALRLSTVHYGWLIVAASFLIRLIAQGVQGSLGVFIIPLQSTFNWDIATISLASSISLLSYAITQPLVGKLTDIWAPRRVVILGGLLLSLGQILLFNITGLWQLYLFYGVMVGVGAGAASLPLTVLVTEWFEKRRGLAVSIVNSALGAGYPTITMIALFSIYVAGWRFASIVVGLISLAVILPVSLFMLRDRPEKPTANGKGEFTLADSAEYRSTPLGGMLADRSFWLMALPYGVCGFTVALISVHLVPLAIDDDVPELAAGGALGVLGLFMTVGLVMAGLFADRVSRKLLLTLSYGIRGLAFLLLLGHPSISSIYAFSIIFGSVELATIPATALLCREFYGAKSMGFAYGLLLFIHQAGGALSSYLGGMSVDLTGSYNLILAGSMLLSFLSAFSSMWIRERSNFLIGMKSILGLDRYTPKLH